MQIIFILINMKKINAIFSIILNGIIGVVIATATGLPIVATVVFFFVLSFLLRAVPNSFCAKIVLTDFIGDIYGKVGSTVYKKNFYGLCRIMKPFPKNPKTEYQKSYRALFGSIYDIFLSLNRSQYNSWKALAQSTPFMKKGKSYFLDVLPFFAKVNQNLKVIGESPISDSPDWSDAPQSFDSFSVDIISTPGSEDMNLNISPAIPSSEKLKIFATPIVGKRQNSVENKLRLIDVLDNTFVSGSSIKDKYIDRFGKFPVTGQSVVFKIENVLKATGRTGMLMTHRAVATA